MHRSLFFSNSSQVPYVELKQFDQNVPLNVSIVQVILLFHLVKLFATFMCSACCSINKGKKASCESSYNVRHFRDRKIDIFILHHYHFLEGLCVNKPLEFSIVP